MKINAIDVEATLDKTKVLLGEETDLSPALRSIIEVLLMLGSSAHAGFRAIKPCLTQ